MKLLKNLNVRLKPFLLEGEPTEVQRLNEPTFRRLYRLALAMGKGTPEQALDSSDLQDKLAKDVNELDLTDSEFNLLKDRVRQNPTQLADFFWGQLLKNLEV